MKITIHRGLQQIGGCITEIATSSTRILIDLGHNLPAADGKPDELIKSIGTLTDGVSAIFYTHYHSDHVGLFHLVSDHVDQYIGQTAKEVLLLKYRRLTSKPEQTGITPAYLDQVERLKGFRLAQQIKVGDMIIRPYLVSHSAADSYMFLIEAQGKRVLHTGDFRQHSVLGGKMIGVIEKHIAKQPVDVLIVEGTMLGRSSERVYHETAISEQMAQVIGRYKNVFVQCSSTDIERLSSIHYANLNQKKPLLCDHYQKQILKLFPHLNKGAKDPFFVYPYNKNPKLDKWIDQEGFTMIVRTSDWFDEQIGQLLKKLDPRETALIYSQWKGYINPKNKAYSEGITRLLPKFDNIHKIHTSGHATVEALAEVCRVVDPQRAIIPIHKEAGADFAAVLNTESLKARVKEVEVFEF